MVEIAVKNTGAVPNPFFSVELLIQNLVDDIFEIRKIIVKNSREALFLLTVITNAFMPYININILRWLLVISLSLCGIELSARSKIDTSAYISGAINYNLLVAAANNYTTEVKKKVKQGANVNVQSEQEGVTPLLYAVQNNNIDLVKFLLKNKAKPNIKAFDGYTPLLLAVELGYADIAETLIFNDAEVKTYNNIQQSALHIAAKNNDLLLCDMLLYYKVWINWQDKSGNTALMSSILSDNLEAFNFLLEKGAKYDITNNNGNTPYHIAARKGYVNILQKLDSLGFDKEMTNKQNHTALTIALKNEQESAVRYLVANGTNVNHTVNNYERPLNYAVEHNNIALIQLLKDNGAEINKRPYFKTIIVAPLINFSQYDAAMGGKVGVYDKRYKIGINTGFFTRLNRIPVLHEKDFEQIYYQFWERRSVFFIELNRSFNYKVREYNWIGITPSVKSCLSTAHFRGVSFKDDKRFFLSPGASIFYQFDFFRFTFDYDYMNYKTTPNPAHRFGFSLQLFLNVKPLFESESIL